MDIIGNESFISCFSKTLQEKKQYMCTVIGPGKTYICKQIFDKCNFDVYDISREETASVTGLAKLLEPHRDVSTIESFFSSKKKMLFLDDFDEYGTNKAFHTYLLNYVKHPNFSTSNVLIVLTISNQNEKFFKDFIKKVETFRLRNPLPCETYEYVIKTHPHTNPNDLKFLCNSVGGNVKSVLKNIDFINRKEFTLHDKSVYDVVHMLYKKEIPIENSDCIYSYDPRIVAMIYFDNMAKVSSDKAMRKNVASYFSDIHTIDEVTHEHSMVTNMWCNILCLQPKIPCSDKFTYDYTRMLNRTIQRYTNNKNIYNHLTSLGIDTDARELYLDVAFDNIILRGKSNIDKSVYDLCKCFINNIGEINKTYLDKLL